MKQQSLSGSPIWLLVTPLNENGLLAFEGMTAEHSPLPSAQELHRNENIRRTPPKWNVIIKNCAFILTCLKFRHLQSTLHLMQYIYQDVFSPLLKTVFELIDFDAF